MRKITLILISFLFPCSLLVAQKRVISIETNVSQEQHLLLQSSLKEYQLVEIDLSKLKLDLSSLSETRLLWDLTDGKEFDMLIYPNDIRSSTYTEAIVSENDIITQEELEVVTYKGYLSDGNSVRLTIDDNFIYGGIETNNGTMVIKQLKYFLNDKSISQNILVLYESGKVKEIESVCGTPNNTETSEKVETVMANSTSAGCKIIEVALDCDTEYWNIYNDNSFNMMLGEINMIQNMYENDVDAILSVTAAQVIIGSTYISTNGSTIINEIKNLWSSSSFSSIPRDLVHHFSGKFLSIGSGRLLGQASNIGDACVVSNPVCFTADAVNGFYTVSHEIGHLLNGIHQDGINCGSSTTRSTMCQGEVNQLFFSPASISRITNFINSKTCFNINTAFISGDSGLCINNTRTYSLTNFEATAGTTITWSVNSRLTILSGQGTKNVVVKGTVNGNGVVSAVLNYPGSCGSITETKNVLVGPPLMTITISGPDQSGNITATANGGISPYTWTLNNNTTWTTSSAITSRYVGCNGAYLYVQSSNSCGLGSGSAFVQPCSGGGYYATVYPNPVSNEIKVIKNIAKEDYRNLNLAFEESLLLTLYDFSSTIVKSMEFGASLEELNLDVSDLKSGNYFLKISGKDLEEVHQIIIE